MERERKKGEVGEEGPSGDTGQGQGWGMGSEEL